MVLGNFQVRMIQICCPLLSSTPGSPQVPIKNSLINPDEDKENEKEGDKEKAVEMKEAQVFNENGDIMTQ